MSEGRELRLHEQRNVLSRLDLRGGVWKWKDKTGAIVYEIPYIKRYMYVTKPRVQCNS